MSIYHRPFKAKRSGSGGKRRRSEDKRLAHMGREPTRTHLAESAMCAARRVRGGGLKFGLRSAAWANVATPKGTRRAKIIDVLSSEASRHFAREKILVKGAIIMTEVGKARITSRPGQHGTVNAVLITE